MGSVRRLLFQAVLSEATMYSSMILRSVSLSMIICEGEFKLHDPIRHKIRIEMIKLIITTFLDI